MLGIREFQYSDVRMGNVLNVRFKVAGFVLGARVEKTI